MNPLYNPGPDDALYFLNVSSSDNNGPDLFDASEDPTGGKRNPNTLPQFDHRAKGQGSTLHTQRKSTSLPPDGALLS